MANNRSTNWCYRRWLFSFCFWRLNSNLNLVELLLNIYRIAARSRFWKLRFNAHWLGLRLSWKFKRSGEIIVIWITPIRLWPRLKRRILRWYWLLTFVFLRFILNLLLNIIFLLWRYLKIIHIILIIRVNNSIIQLGIFLMFQLPIFHCFLIFIWIRNIYESIVLERFQILREYIILKWLLIDKIIRICILIWIIAASQSV